MGHFDAMVVFSADWYLRLSCKAVKSVLQIRGTSALAVNSFRRPLGSFSLQTYSFNLTAKDFSAAFPVETGADSKITVRSGRV
jgi:hypothetical protein